MAIVLEDAARAVATASGYHYSGDSILENAMDNPRSAFFVQIADAVLDVAAKRTTGLSDTLIGDCAYRGPMDPETGEIPCSRRNGCSCDELTDHAGAMSQILRARP